MDKILWCVPCMREALPLLLTFPVCSEVPSFSSCRKNQFPKGVEIRVRITQVSGLKTS